ncbi:MAG: 50S ribosomal protein L22 [Acidimicrobiia bacterium]|nr:50S ribosomal protein L22 [Acidimicrobiia bacterium]MYE74521.1 50S ribosomal protein L22 [Acidimicrobiia bacterium]MYJ62966.1 50S ribosomal protein L22 [Acidimicrobiia bacterium]
MAAVTVGSETRPGSRAVAKYVRSSAFKAREVLDLVRGKSYSEAREILTFSERRISDTIAKCLDSAVANAEHNDELDGEELFVAACYADEGPTLKRWRPRARGRATRIRKRTCHITVVVARYTDEELAAIDARLALKGTGRRSSAAEARRRRVAASRERDAERAAEQERDQDEDDLEALEGDLDDEALEADFEDAADEDADVEEDDDEPVAEDAADEEDDDEPVAEDAADEDEEKES